MEHIVKSHIMHYAGQNQLLFHSKHGFRSNKSCKKQLIKFVADITNIIYQRKQLEACVLDFLMKSTTQLSSQS